MNDMTQVRRARLAAFAAAQATSDAGRSSPLQISALRAYPLREPVSGRSYTVIKLQTRGGLEGYGECGSVTSTELAKALKIVQGKEATPFETVRFQLRSTPSGLAAALNMAMLDLVGRSVKTPIYQVLGGPTRNKIRVYAHAGTPEAMKANNLEPNDQMPPLHALIARMLSVDPNQRPTSAEALRLYDEITGGAYMPPPRA